MSVKDSKRYYWLKLKEDFFNDEAIDWLEEQRNGKEYVLFYLKLCLKSLKDEGTLIRTVGNILVPYDADKLGEITKTNKDTVIVALELLKKIGLVEIQENGVLYLTKLKDMVGSETSAAERKRRYRESLKAGKGDNVPRLSQNCPGHFPLEYRDKSIENREKIVSSTKKESSNVRTDELSSLVDFCNNNVEILTPFKLQMIEGYVTDFGIEWVQKGLEKLAGLERSKQNVKYLGGVLDGWKRDGVPKPWEQRKKVSEEETMISSEDFIKEQELRRKKQQELNNKLAEIAEERENGKFS